LRPRRLPRGRLGRPRDRVRRQRRTLTGTWTGLAGTAEGWREWLSAWDSFHQEAIDYRDVDAERVLVSFRFCGRGKTSGLDLAQMYPLSAGVFHLRNGRVTRFVGYLHHERALEAVGLSE
jgi:hypothetical protein